MAGPASAPPSPPGGAERDPEAAYYQSVEEFFVERRGDPLFLSNADWLLIRRWRTAGVPLRVVLRGIADALDGHARSWGRRRKVGSLAYCAAEVEQATERWRRALAVGGEEGADAGAALLAFAKALDGASLPGPRARAEARAFVSRLRAWSAAPPDLRELEPQLASAERALVRALREEDEPAAVLALQADAEAELAPYAGRMPEKVLAQVRAESLARRILVRHGLPRLSLLTL